MFFSFLFMTLNSVLLPCAFLNYPTTDLRVFHIIDKCVISESIRSQNLRKTASLKLSLYNYMARLSAEMIKSKYLVPTCTFYGPLVQLVRS